MGTTINGMYVGGLEERRKRALIRLVAQLKSGKKTVKKTFEEKQALDEKDITRINGEIEKLKKLL